MTSLYTEVNGAGPPLILLHGWGLNVRVWDSILPALTARFRVIAVDLPGHGRSGWHESAKTLSGYTQLVAESVRECSSASTTLLGWSLGGEIALELAGHGAGRLVLVATTPKFAASEDWPQGMSASVLEGFARQLATDYRQTVSDFLELQVRGSANSDVVLKMLRDALFQHGEAQPQALAAGLELLNTTDLRPKLPAITQPTVVISGQYDRVTPSRAGRALAELLPNAKFVELRRAGHAPFLSHPQEFLDAFL